MKIYLSGPFYTEKECKYIEFAEKILRYRGCEVFSPREHKIKNSESMKNHIWGKLVFENDVSEIDSADILIAIYDGIYSDTRTAWEIGYAYAKGIPIILICTAFYSDQSIMPVNAATTILNDIKDLAKCNLKELPTRCIVPSQK